MFNAVIEAMKDFAVVASPESELSDCSPGVAAWPRFPDAGSRSPRCSRRTPLLGLGRIDPLPARR